MSHVPAPERRHAVVVGVSPRTGSVAALRWGAQEAQRRDADLFAVTAWHGPRPPATSGGRMPTLYQDPDQLSAQATTDLEKHVADVLGPDRQVECRVVHGSELTMLLKVSELTELVVVDAPRRIRRPATLPLSTRLLRSAQCPVVIMPFSMQEKPVRFTGILPRKRSLVSRDDS